MDDDEQSNPPTDMYTYTYQKKNLNNMYTYTHQKPTDMYTYTYKKKI
jgi:hypothetical protein